MTGKAIQILSNGVANLGQAYKPLTNGGGYPVLLDLNNDDLEEPISLYVRFRDEESLHNVSALTLIFGFSTTPGDDSCTNAAYAVIAGPGGTQPGAFIPGEWILVQIPKKNFAPSGIYDPTQNWSSVSAIKFLVNTIGVPVGGNDCAVDLDVCALVESGKLFGTDYKWTYTYYDSRVDTESDYADPVDVPNPGAVYNRYKLSFPANPDNTPPLADPDTIKIYRIGGTITQYQLVDTIPYVANATPADYYDDIPDSLLGAVMDTDNQLPADAPRGCEIFDDRLWTWGGSIAGIAEPPNRLRFSKNVNVEEFPAANFVQVGSGSEQIQRVLENDSELFIFTRIKVYRLVGSAGQYRAVSAGVNQGLVNPFDLCRGVKGLYMRTYDGIYEFPSGRKISEPVNQIFFGTIVNEIWPVSPGREWEECLAFYDSKVFFSYCATDDPLITNDRMLVWDTIYERWHWYLYGARNMYFEPETSILVGGTLVQWASIVDGEAAGFTYSGAWPMRLENGFRDQLEAGFLGIPWAVDTKEYDLGYPDQEKRFIDFIIDADTAGYPVGIEAGFDLVDYNRLFTHDPLGKIVTSGRQRTILPVPLEDGSSRLAVRVQIRITATTAADAASSTRIYKIVHRILLEPPRHRTFVTEWSDYGVPSPKFLRELWIDIDTFGVALDSIEVQVDQAVAQIIQANTICNGQTRFFYGLNPDIRGTLARLRIVPQGINEVKLYDHGFQSIAEPSTTSTVQMPYTDNGYPYRKLWKNVQIDIDTGGRAVTFDFWLDGIIVQTFEVITDHRQRFLKSFDQNLFGKLGRLTVTEDFIDPVTGATIEFRHYGAPLFVTDEHFPDVTIADSFVRTLNYDRYKIARRLWLAMRNPDSAVSLQIYVNNILRDTITIAAEDTFDPAFSKRRIDFKSALKGNVFRFVFTSTFAFEIYWNISEIELKGLNVEDGYNRVRLEAPQTY